MNFQIYSRPEGLIGATQWRWRLVAGNGQIIASGEGYFNKADCLHAIGLVQGTNASTPITHVAA